MHVRSLACLGAILALATACAPVATTPAVADAAAKDATYTMADFARVAKFDAHVHANTAQRAFLDQAAADNFELLTINVDYPVFPSIADQRTAALALAKADPARLHWAATFSMDGFGTPQWRSSVGQAIDAAANEGALAVKIWKNVGMIEKDAQGRLVMLDHPALAPVAEHVRARGLALIGHQGEPHNCWLPLEQMTTDNDREYFANHPQYHMYLHPDEPSYEDHMAVRDRFVAAHPRLRFVGAHMASLEYDVDRLGAFLDRFPNASIDLAARMSQVQYQSVRDRERVRRFFIRHQDRILYGTDLTQAPDTEPDEMRRTAHTVWTADWRYLATAETQHVDMIGADVAGLALPRAVIDKIYHHNARRVFLREGNAD